jgi:hypothetical protein
MGCGAAVLDTARLLCALRYKLAMQYATDAVTL